MNSEVNKSFLLKTLVKTIEKMIETDKNRHNAMHGLVRMVSIKRVDDLLKNLKDDDTCNNEIEFKVGFRSMLITEQSGVLSILEMAEDLIVTTAGKSYLELVTLLHLAITATIVNNQ